MARLQHDPTKRAVERTVVESEPGRILGWIEAGEPVVEPVT
jgi:hypothetical protein